MLLDFKISGNFPRLLSTSFPTFNASSLATGAKYFSPGSIVRPIFRKNLIKPLPCLGFNDYKKRQLENVSVRVFFYTACYRMKLQMKVRLREEAVRDRLRKLIG